MKKITFFTLGLALLLTNQSFAIRENKIIRVGYVNYAQLVAKVDQDGNIQKQVDRIRHSYDEKIQDLQQEVENLQEKVASNSSDSNIASNVTLLEEKTLELSLLKIKATQDIEKTTSGLLTRVNEKIKPAIENIAKKQNFDIIIDSSLVLLGIPSLDITNFVLASL